MHTFPELIKKIREESGLTQAEFARTVGVSTVLITMVETGRKEVSKNLLLKLAAKMEVSPSSITPFLFIGEKQSIPSSAIEKMFVNWGQKMQDYLIKDRAKLLRNGNR